jgi:hypothetical protein
LLQGRICDDLTNPAGIFGISWTHFSYVVPLTGFAYLGFMVLLSSNIKNKVYYKLNLKEVDINTILIHLSTVSKNPSNSYLMDFFIIGFYKFAYKQHNFISLILSMVKNLEQLNLLKFMIMKKLLLLFIILFWRYSNSNNMLTSGNDDAIDNAISPKAIKDKKANKTIFIYWKAFAKQRRFKLHSLWNKDNPQNLEKFIQHTLLLTPRQEK